MHIDKTSDHGIPEVKLPGYNAVPMR